jgi:hypothetical protein
MIALARSNNIVEFPQKSNEWYTPARYIEAVREVMGGIDLDPASCELANQTVKAEKYYSLKDNGLVQEWHGRVWLNPPYGLDKSKPNNQRSTIKMWIDKLVQEYQVNHVHQAIALVTTQMNAIWFQSLWQFSICFPDHNIRFFLPFGSKKGSRPGRMTDGHIFGSCFVYLGFYEHKFIEVFSQFGTIAKQISLPKVQYVNLSLWETLK